MDYFDILLAKKLNGGGGDITIEDLYVNANGEYRAPSGKPMARSRQMFLHLPTLYSNRP